MDKHSDLSQQLAYLNQIGIELSREQKIDRLLEHILQAAQTITNADGGTLYLMNEARDGLRFAILRTASLGIAYGGTTGKPASWPEIPLRNEDGSENHSLVVAHTALTGNTINIEDVRHAEGFDFSGTRRFDAANGYSSRSFLSVPMQDHQGEIIGVLQMINALDPDSGQICRFSGAHEGLVASLASQAAVALTNRMLIEQMRTLFVAFTRLINQAIDEKSPHTGGHCQRVPVLTMLIAEALHDNDAGPLAGFSMSEQDREELEIAGLLHDCGKITTPVHVVDKATKLETIFDRIRLVDCRFEIILRDAELEMLRACRGGEDAPAAEQALADFRARVAADRTFLHRANVGSEAMEEADQQRVREIATRYRWYAADGSTHPLLDSDEVANLCIRAGTLTAAEREIINHHVVSTQRMLEALPWPRHLARVPEYAGNHHERMDGRGYPRGLTRMDMSVQARIMCIADIFEALTASDRPYKKPMTLSTALGILARMAGSGHVDPDIFEVFLRSKAYHRYAERFLAAGQIDVVDEAAILAASRPECVAQA